jgi:hypothetical protein
MLGKLITTKERRDRKVSKGLENISPRETQKITKSSAPTFSCLFVFLLATLIPVRFLMFGIISPRLWNEVEK